MGSLWIFTMTADLTKICTLNKLFIHIATHCFALVFLVCFLEQKNAQEAPSCKQGWLSCSSCYVPFK